MRLLVHLLLVAAAAATAVTAMHVVAWLTGYEFHRRADTLAAALASLAVVRHHRWRDTERVAAPPASKTG